MWLQLQQFYLTLFSHWAVPPHNQSCTIWRYWCHQCWAVSLVGRRMTVVLSLMFNDHESAGHVEHTCYDPSSHPSSAGNRESIKIMFNFLHTSNFIFAMHFKRAFHSIKKRSILFYFYCILKTWKSSLKWTLWNEI